MVEQVIVLGDSRSGLLTGAERQALSLAGGLSKLVLSSSSSSPLFPKTSSAVLLRPLLICSGLRLHLFRVVSSAYMCVAGRCPQKVHIFVRSALHLLSNLSATEWMELTERKRTLIVSAGSEPGCSTAKRGGGT